MLGIKDDVVGHVEVEIAVAVAVKEGRAGAVLIATHAGCSGRIGKAVAAIAVEYVGPVVGHIEVWAAVVVDVAHGHATAPTGVADSGFSGDFHKSTVAAVAVERVARP